MGISVKNIYKDEKNMKKNINLKLIKIINTYVKTK